MGLHNDHYKVWLDKPCCSLVVFTNHYRKGKIHLMQISDCINNFDPDINIFLQGSFKVEEFRTKSPSTAIQGSPTLPCVNCSGAVVLKGASETCFCQIFCFGAEPSLVL